MIWCTAYDTWKWERKKRFCRKSSCQYFILGSRPVLHDRSFISRPTTFVFAGKPVTDLMFTNHLLYTAISNKLKLILLMTDRFMEWEPTLPGPKGKKRDSPPAVAPHAVRIIYECKYCFLCLVITFRVHFN